MSSYVGRFAPTPSGALHFGSLVTALGSCLDARASKGRWLLRIDDLDRPRVKPESEEIILRQLDDHGLNWDGPLRRQSEHVDEYRDALDKLRRGGHLYACRCTRAQLAVRPVDADEDGEPVYAGTCRESGWPEQDAALRYRVDMTSGTGDFVVRRRDGVPAYQLACAVDEAAQKITHVVRGADLASSAERQSELMRALGLPVPRYLHLPLLLDPDGRKLGKRNESKPIEAASATENLLTALRLLGQPLPEGGPGLQPRAIIAAAAAGWRPDLVPAGPIKPA